MLRTRDILTILAATVAAAMLLKAFVLDAVVIPSSSMEGTLLPGDFVLVNKLSYGNFLLPAGNNLQAAIPFTKLFTRKNIKRGDVVIFNFPAPERNTLLDENDLLVKRCIAKSGDVVKIQQRKIWVNDIRAGYIHSENRSGYSSSAFFPPNSDFSFDDYGPIRVPQKGDIVELNEANFSQWERLIREEGHSIRRASANTFFIDGEQRNIYIVEKNYLFVLGDNYYHSFDSRFWGFLPEDHVIGSAALVYWSLDTQDSKQAKGISHLFDSVRWDRIGNTVQ